MGSREHCFRVAGARGRSGFPWRHHHLRSEPSGDWDLCKPALRRPVQGPVTQSCSGRWDRRSTTRSSSVCRAQDRWRNRRAGFGGQSGPVLMLMRYKDGDANVRSVWICSRNDAIGNVVVVVAAAGVWANWNCVPDVGVAALMANLSHVFGSDLATGVGRISRRSLYASPRGGASPMANAHNQQEDRNHRHEGVSGMRKQSLPLLSSPLRSALVPPSWRAATGYGMSPWPMGPGMMRSRNVGQHAATPYGYDVGNSGPHNALRNLATAHALQSNAARSWPTNKLRPLPWSERRGRRRGGQRPQPASGNLARLSQMPMVEGSVHVLDRRRGRGATAPRCPRSRIRCRRTTSGRSSPTSRRGCREGPSDRHSRVRRSSRAASTTLNALMNEVESADRKRAA